MVEFIIVIAIVGIMSALGFVTINIVFSAKASAAGNTLISQMTYLESMTKAQDPNLAMELYFDDSESRYYIRYGTVDDAGVFTENTSIDKVSVSNSIRIFYTPTSGSRAEIDSSTSVVIQFNKSDGSVKMGSGTYEVCKNKKTTGYSIALNKNTGSHYIK